ncbi:hypothetical protein P8610_11430 [Fictibacillus sp. UD]
MVGAQGVRLSARTSGQVRPLRAQSGKGLTACPAESEQPGAEINHFQKQQSFSKTRLSYYIHLFHMMK